MAALWLGAAAHAGPRSGWSPVSRRHIVSSVFSNSCLASGLPTFCVPKTFIAYGRDMFKSSSGLPFIRLWCETKERLEIKSFGIFFGLAGTAENNPRPFATTTQRR